MSMSRAVNTVLALSAMLLLTACFAETTPPDQDQDQTQDQASIVRTLEQLEGAEVQLAVGETLGVDPQGADPAFYNAMILDGSIAAYEPSVEGSQIRIAAVAVGTTDVLLGDPDERVDDVAFTLIVVE